MRNSTHPNTAAIKSDLVYVFQFFPLESLVHLSNNRHRLIRGHYQQGDKGCLFFLLSEVLPANRRIESRQTLVRYFTGGSGPRCESLAAVRPARDLVSAVDGRVHELSDDRYGPIEQLDWDIVLETLHEEIESRQRRMGNQFRPPQVVGRIAGGAVIAG